MEPCSFHNDGEKDRNRTGRYINIKEFSGTTADSFQIAGEAGRATDFPGHLQGHLTQDKMPPQPFQIPEKISVDMVQ